MNKKFFIGVLILYAILLSIMIPVTITGIKREVKDIETQKESLFAYKKETYRIRGDIFWAYWEAVDRIDTKNTPGLAKAFWIAMGIPPEEYEGSIAECMKKMIEIRKEQEEFEDKEK